MSATTLDERIKHALAHLSKSERGLRAIADLTALLDNGACSLDRQGQESLVMLLTSAFGSKAGTTLELLRDPY